MELLKKISITAAFISEKLYSGGNRRQYRRNKLTERSV